MSTAVYEFQATDLRTGDILSDLPLESVSWSKSVMKTGAASGSFLAAHGGGRNLDELRYATTPAHTGVYIIRNGYPIWGGITWRREYDSSTRKVKLSFETFDSYWAKRFQRASKTFHSVAGTWGAADGEQIAIARWLLNNAAAVAGGNIQISIDSTVNSSFYRDRQFNYWEFKYVLDELNSLTSLDGGFEYSMEVYTRPDGFIGRRLLFGYPRVGRPINTTDLLYTYPGNIIKFAPSEDGKSACNTMYGIGGGEGPSQLTSTRAYPSQIDGGYPLLENSNAYKDISIKPLLDDRTTHDLAKATMPVNLVPFSIKPGVDNSTRLDRITPGDYCKLRIKDDWYDYRASARISQIDVSAPTKSSVETASLTLGDSGDQHGF